MLQGQTHSIFFLDPQDLWAPTMRILSETSNNRAVYCMLNHGSTLVQLLHYLSLSSCQLESTLPPAAQLHWSQSQLGDLVRHHLWLLNSIERISWPSCAPRYAANTSHHKQETFLYEYPLHRVLLLAERCSLVVHTSSTVAILTTETSLWTCTCASAT
jgi:hypothetical protein